MKIIKSKKELCAVEGRDTSKDVRLSDVPTGTVFRYGEHRCGPYLRLMTGYLDLSTYLVYVTVGMTPLNNYMPLPAAVLVTGEDA